MGSHSVTCHPAVATFPPLPQACVWLSDKEMKIGIVQWVHAARPGHCVKCSLAVVSSCLRSQSPELLLLLLLEKQRL